VSAEAPPITAAEADLLAAKWQLEFLDERVAAGDEFVATESVVELATALVRLIGVQAEEREAVVAAVTRRFREEIDRQARRLAAGRRAGRSR
jgi:hypothetical protein